MFNERGQALYGKVGKVSKGSKVAKAKISSKYQITLPKEVREGLGIEAGDELYIAREGEKIIIGPLPKVKRPTEAIYGSVKSRLDAVKAIREFRKSGGRAR